MNKKFSAVLCIAALLGSMSTGFAQDVIISQGNSESFSSDQSFDGGYIANEGTVVVDENITLSNLATVSNSGTFTTATGSAINSNVMQNNTGGSLSNAGTITIAQDITNNGEITSNTGSIITNSLSNTRSGSISSAGIITASGGIDNSGTITNSGSLNGTGSIINSGTLTNSGTGSKIENTASIFNNDGGTIRNEGEITTTSSITNNGTITNSNSMSSTDYIENNKIITNETGAEISTGSISNTSKGDDTQAGITNNGTITATNSINNSGTIENNSSISATNIIENSGTITNNNGGSVETAIISNIANAEISNSGGITVTNAINNAGTITNNSTGILSASYLENTKSLINNGTASATDNISNSGTISGDSGTLNIKKGVNTGGITQGTINLTGDLNNSSNIEAKTSFQNSGNLSGTGNLTAAGGSNTATIEQNNITLSGSFSNTGSITSNGTFTNTSTMTGDNGELVINNGGSNTSSITQDKITVNGGTYTNSADTGSIVANTITNNNNSIITNNGTITATNSISNSGTISGDSGTLNIKKGVNTGGITQGTISLTGDLNNSSNIEAKTSFQNSGSLFGTGNLTAAGGSNTATIEQNNVNLSGSFSNTGSITSNGTFTNASTMTGAGDLVINNGGSNTGSITQDEITVNGGTYTNSADTGSIVANTITNNNNSIITNNGTLNTGTLTNTINATINNNGSLIVTGNMSNLGTIINSGAFDSGTGSTMTNNGTFISSGANASMNATNITNNKIFGANNGAKLELDNIVNNNTIQITNGSSLNITAQAADLGGNIISTGENNSLGVAGADIVSNLQVGDGNTISSLTLTNGNVVKDAVINVTQNATFNIDNKASSVIFNDNATDTWSGGVNLVNGTLTLDNFKENASGTASYSQSGGDLYLNNNSSLSVGDSSLIKDGNMYIDDSSSFYSLSNGYSLSDVKHSGILGAMNSGREDYTMTNMIIGNAVTGDNQADFTIDVHGRSNAAAEHGTDRFITENIFEDAGLGSATINIADWGLAGDIFGWDAPIDKHITLQNIFSGNISQNINLTSTSKEVFTPIGWYQLNNHGGIGGTYTLDLTRFNPQVYRGQVTTVAQWMNQLAIDDMLFNHSMVLPSFKDEDGGVAYSGMMANRYASTMPQFAPYQYSRKDGGLWYKMYGTFETLQMSQGLGNVGNNAYGALIGADFGLKELKHGWKFMPTAYIGYNGAHQYWAGMGAYQNGGQAGFLGTWYKNNFIIGGLVYGGIYDNSMDVAGRVDSTFNYFAGAATKAAYNWRFHRDWVLQPNLFLAYNFFGQQNWHSEFGQMGMMSGILNGINLAPGVNLIWEKETFSIYATLQYMYNLNGAVGGRAGNVGLPHIYMERGYIQYGLGFTKRFTDRFSGYLQAVFRNVGRTGVGFQMGFNFLLGK